MFKLFSILFAIKILSCVASECEVKLRESKIIPDIIDDFEASRMLNVTFLEPLECGVQLTPNEVRMEPEITWNTSGEEFFTILMSDCTQMDEMRHWLVMNIPGNQVEKGEKVVEYLGAMPMESSGIHRYVILLLHQTSGKVKIDEKFIPQNSMEGRSSTSTKKLIEKFALKPVASNFFMAEYDTFVPVIQQDTFGEKK